MRWTDYSSYFGVADKILLNKLEWFESLKAVSSEEIFHF